MAEAGEYQQAMDELQGALEKGLRGFAKWYAENWLLEDEANWKRSFKDPWPGEEYRKGFNAGVEAVTMGLEVFMNEHLT